MPTITLCTFSTGTVLVREVLDDWRAFMADHPPDATVFAVPSARGAVAPIYGELRDEGRVTRVVPVEANGRSHKDLDALGIVAAMRAIDTDYALLMKLDTLPWQNGNGGWLDDAIATMARGGHWGFSGSFGAYDSQPAEGRYLKTQRFSHNFAIVDPRKFVDVVRGACGDWVLDADRATPEANGFDRFFAERAVEDHLKATGGSILFRPEDPDWTVFHVNCWGEQLRQVRTRYLRREGLRPFLNIGRERRSTKYPWEYTYGMPRPPLQKRLRIVLGSWRRGLVQRVRGRG